MFSAFNPKKGSLLLSEPFMLDSNFKRSVILLCEHNTETGSMGFILNHRSSLLLQDVVPNIENDTIPIYIGGPVEIESLFFLHHIPDKIPGGTHLIDNIYFGGDFNQVTFLLNANMLTVDEVKFFIGYAGWGNDQLAQEIEENSWAVHNKFPSDILFLTDGEDLWKEALISLGPKYAHVANFPQSPDLN
ncbi:YqgE/AlgH family protein [Sphingobacterium psychroaquaticum]|uniref:Putative transcriptional regulator n=1 Tax=Sphingobacterium psychroaquaticum TaxID=561061 RepID=A0A1X7JRS4_9SPHI|nr:YqgE/AlgH family protein [Sphingobacterium psychroaquaticum]SMG30740.1 putative transcriptional regulator [Sphingobacterium psychroaquaticum]